MSQAGGGGREKNKIIVEKFKFKIFEPLLCEGAELIIIRHVGGRYVLCCVLRQNQHSGQRRKGRLLGNCVNDRDNFLPPVFALHIM